MRGIRLFVPGLFFNVLFLLLLGGIPVLREIFFVNIMEKAGLLA